MNRIFCDHLIQYKKIVPHKPRFVLVYFSVKMTKEKQTEVLSLQSTQVPSCSLYITSPATHPVNIKTSRCFHNVHHSSTSYKHMSCRGNNLRLGSIFGLFGKLPWTDRGTVV